VKDDLYFFMLKGGNLVMFVKWWYV